MSASLKTNSRLKNKRRPGDPWISKNRVLNGGTGKSKRNCAIYRNPNFDTDETKLLIQLWGDPKTQRELITTHKKHAIIAQLSAKMEEYGYYRSPEEITTRIKNMKCFYNRLKKEMENCKGLDHPSWRHYAEMDAVMTRPIFSVRPNEVPVASLKYLLEQEQEKRKERKRQAEEEGHTISDSDEDIADILAVPASAASKSSLNKNSNEADYIEPEAEIEFEADETTLAALENVTQNSDKSTNEENKSEQAMSDAELAIKMEIESEEFQEYNENETTDTTTRSKNLNKAQEATKTINLSENDDLLMPKVEPIDVDEEYENKGKQPQTLVPDPTQTPNTLTHILKQPTKSHNLATQAIIKFAMPNSSTATSISSSTTSIPAQSKISVVSPTILMSPHMSPKSPAESTMTPRQVRLGGNLHALLAASGSRTTVTNANGMKFLLVNAADQRGPPVTTSTVSSTLTSNINAATSPTSMKILPKTTQFQQQQQQQQQQQKSQQKPQISLLKPKEQAKRLEVRHDYKEQLKKRDLLGIKTTLLKILKVQEDANDIQKERLAIERERLQFERTIADKFLNIFEQNQKFQQKQQQQPPQQQHFQIQQRPTSQVFTTNAAQSLTPSGQIMLPPKLLITTMVPTSAAQAVGGVSPMPSNVITTAGFANVAAKQNNDVQLLVPKEEPQN